MRGRCGGGIDHSLFGVRIPRKEDSLPIAGASRNSCSLYLLSSHVCAKVWFSPLEEFMGVLPKHRGGAVLDSIKAVNVDLTDEGLVLNLGKELGESSFRKFGSVQDLEGKSIGHPRDVGQVFIPARIIAHMIQHLVETERKVKLMMIQVRAKGDKEDGYSVRYV